MNKRLSDPGPSARWLYGDHFNEGRTLYLVIAIRVLISSGKRKADKVN
jgi:hypothetical protein